MSEPKTWEEYCTNFHPWSSTMPMSRATWDLQRSEKIDRLEKALRVTLGELQAIQAAAALSGLPANVWAGFGKEAKSALGGEE